MHVAPLTLMMDIMNLIHVIQIARMDWNGCPVNAVFAKTRWASSSEQDRISLAQLETILRGLRTPHWPGEFNTPNITFTRHIPVSTGNFVIPAVLSSFMQELMHTLYKHKLSNQWLKSSSVAHAISKPQASLAIHVAVAGECCDKTAKDPAV